MTTTPLPQQIYRRSQRGYRCSYDCTDIYRDDDDEEEEDEDEQDDDENVGDDEDVAVVVIMMRLRGDT